jgi:putative transposase
MVCGLKNRAENAHLLTRRLKKIMSWFTSARHLQRFLSIHFKIANRSMMLAKPGSERVR